MPVYRYKGVAAGNRSVAATIDADSMRAARQMLRAEGIYPTEISEGRTRGVTGETLSRWELPSLRRGVPDLDLAMFSSQLATLLSAGVPLVQALGALTEQVDHERLKSTIGAVREEVNQGNSLGDAMAEFPHIFDELYVSMVRSGESSGALDVVLARLSEYVENRMELSNKLINAMVYPLMMLLFSVAVAGVLLVYVIPNITQLLTDMDQELPLITRITVALSDFVTTWWSTGLLAGAAGFLLANRAIRTQRGRRVWDGFRMSIPVVGRLVRLVAISRFARTLSALVAGRLNIVTALDISRNVTGNAVVGDAIERARESIQKGSTIAATLRSSGEFPAMVTHMIAVGEASGELDTMLAKVADTYDQLVDNALTRLLALVGPIMLVVVAGMILMIILSTLLPLLSLTSAL